MNKRSTRILILLTVLAAIWQALGALFYMVLLGHSSLAPFIYVLSKIGMIALPIAVILIGWQYGTFFKKTKFYDVLLGLGIGTIFFVVIFGAFQFFPELFDKAFVDVLPRAKAFGIANPITFIIVGLIFSIFHSLFEEFYWRWFIFGTMKSLLPVKAAIVLSGVAFSLHHILALTAFTTPLLAIIFGLLVGAIGSFWSLLYVWRGNLTASWISHIAADLAIISAGYVILFLS